MVPEDKVSRRRKRRSKAVEKDEQVEQLQELEEVETDSKVQVEQEVRVVKPVVVPKVTFSAWFSSKVKKRKLKYWQESALEVFMGKQGLTVLEPEDKYEEAFKRF